MGVKNRVGFAIRLLRWVDEVLVIYYLFWFPDTVASMALCPSDIPDPDPALWFRNPRFGIFMTLRKFSGLWILSKIKNLVDLLQVNSFCRAKFLNQGNFRGLGKLGTLDSGPKGWIQPEC